MKKSPAALVPPKYCDVYMKIPRTLANSNLTPHTVSKCGKYLQGCADPDLWPDTVSNLLLTSANEYIKRLLIGVKLPSWLEITNATDLGDRGAILVYHERHGAHIGFHSSRMGSHYVQYDMSRGNDGYTTKNTQKCGQVSTTSFLELYFVSTMVKKC